MDRKQPYTALPPVDWHGSVYYISELYSFLLFIIKQTARNVFSDKLIMTSDLFIVAGQSTEEISKKIPLQTFHRA